MVCGGVCSVYLREDMAVLPAVLPELHGPLRGGHQADGGDLPVGEGEDGGLVARRGGELGEGNRGVPAGEDRDGGVLGGCPHEHGLVVDANYLAGVNLKQSDRDWRIFKFLEAGRRGERHLNIKHIKINLYLLAYKWVIFLWCDSMGSLWRKSPLITIPHLS